MTLVDADFYAREEVDAVLDKLAVNGSWAQGEFAKKVKEEIGKTTIFTMVISREDDETR